MNVVDRQQLEKYEVLINLFVDGRIAGNAFEVLFFPLFKGDPTRWSQDVFGVLEGIFTAVDDYNSHEPDATKLMKDEGVLRTYLHQALGRLSELEVK